MKRWLFSSFLVSFLSLALAGAQVIALAVSWVVAAEESGSDEREEQTSRTPHESRAGTRKTKPRAFPLLTHPIYSCTSFPLAARSGNDFVAIEVALPDKIPILRV